MCNTNVEMDFYYVNICKHEHEKNMTRLWCKIVRLMLNKLKEMIGPIFIYTRLGTQFKEASKEAFMYALSK